MLGQQDLQPVMVFFQPYEQAVQHIRLRPHRTTVDYPAKHLSTAKSAVFCGGQAHGFLRRRVVIVGDMTSTFLFHG